VITAWTKNLKTEEDKQKFEKSVKSAKHVLDRLTEILGEMEDELNSSELSPKNYDSPNWDYKQAHVNGQKSALRAIKTLINLDQGK
jgi:hypothetical protein